MHQINQDKAQMLRHSSELWWLDAGALRVGSGQGAGLGTAPRRAYHRTNAECYFSFLPFLYTGKNLLCISFD